MYTDILYDVFLGLVCVSVVFLIMILWRTYLILTDVNLISKSVKNIAKKIEGAVSSVSRGIGSAKEFVEGFESIADVIGGIFKRRTEKSSEKRGGEDGK